MKKLTQIFILSLIIFTHLISQQKLAQTGMKFLNVGSFAQITGMGEAVTSVEGNSTSMFYNPAGMARITSLADVSFGQTSWIADINHNYFTVASSLTEYNFGVIGIMGQFVDYGLIEGTILANNSKGYLDESDLPGLNIKPNASMFGISYAQALSDRFSVGGNVKYVRQDLGESYVTYSSTEQTKNTAALSVWAFDFGVLYKTGLKSLTFGMTLKNFSQEAKYEKESFQLPLIFKIGLSANIADFIEVDRNVHSLLLSIDATHPRDYPEQINLGAEYVFLKLFALRGGYMSNNDEYDYTYGAGVRQEFQGIYLAVDYSYTPFGKYFNPVHRFSFQVTY
ncbi:MAG: PorV/PorQ family protein [Ignavibacteria bacterium]|nr:PorV/PorQ family protein [Bacteroidota bacterium]MSQ46642.1 PorV/PorQ family protein [Ignavibacteria bacterium]